MALCDAASRHDQLHIERLLQCELSFINTSHSDFIGGSAAVALIMERIQAKIKAKTASGPNGSSSTSGGSSSSNGGGGGAGSADDIMSSTLSGMNLNKDNRTPSSASSSTQSQQQAHARAANNATVAQPPTAAPVSSAAAARNQPQSSNWGFPSLFGRTPSPSTKYAAQQQQSQPGSREAERKHLSGAGAGAPMGGVGGNVYSDPHLHSSMEDHELYSGLSSSSSVPSSRSMSHQSISASSSSSSNGLGSSSWHLKSLEPSEREMVETEVIKILMESYFRIVRKSVADQVPKAIICFLVTRMKKELQAELVRELYQPHLLDILLREADDIGEKRESCRELLQILQRAMDILNQARDFNAMATTA